MTQLAAIAPIPPSYSVNSYICQRKPLFVFCFRFLWEIPPRTWHSQIHLLECNLNCLRLEERIMSSERFFQSFVALQFIPPLMKFNLDVSRTIGHPFARRKHRLRFLRRGHQPQERVMSPAPPWLVLPAMELATELPTVMSRIDWPTPSPSYWDHIVGAAVTVGLR